MLIYLKIITWVCQERHDEVFQYKFLLFLSNFVELLGKYLQSDSEVNTVTVIICHTICTVSQAMLAYICWYEWQLRFLMPRQVRNWAEAAGRSLLRRLENHFVMTLWFLSCSSVSWSSLSSLIMSRTSVANGTTVFIGCWWNKLQESSYRKLNWALQRGEMRLTMLAKMSRAVSKTMVDLISNIFQIILEWLLFPGKLHFRSDVNWWAVKFTCWWGTITSHLVCGQTFILAVLTLSCCENNIKSHLCASILLQSEITGNLHVHI